MRLRNTVLLLVFAALPVALALVFVANGSLRAPSGRAPVLPNGGRSAHITLSLVTASARVPGSQCDAVRHYYPFPSQGTIHFDGKIAPHGHWTVTVKLKACFGGAFQPTGAVQARVLGDGTFAGSFPIPIAGYYYARAELRRSGTQIARSQKTFFKVG